MIKGFEILKSKNTKEFVDYSEIEYLLGTQLPKDYLLLANLFELGDANINSPKYLDPIINLPTDCGLVLFKAERSNGEYSFNGFYSYIELKQDWYNYSSDSEEFRKHKLLRIGDLGIGGGLFIGLEGDKKGKVFLVNWDAKEDFELLSDSIFEFVKLLFYCPEELNLRKGTTFSDLYKNWGEDFWRIREK